MRKMTEKNLRDAFSGESQASMKYLNFSMQAEKEGFPGVAKLFKAISFAERVHASNHLKALGDLKKTVENLQTAIDGETFEVEEMYPSYDAVANLQNESEAKKSIHYAVEAEKLHAKIYMDAKSQVAEGKDFDVKNVYICKVCGYTALNNAPHKCPVCGASFDFFETF